MSTPARTRAEKQSYVNTLRLTDSQKNGFVNSGLNQIISTSYKSVIELH